MATTGVKLYALTNSGICSIVKSDSAIKSAVIFKLPLPSQLGIIASPMVIASIGSIVAGVYILSKLDEVIMKKLVDENSPSFYPCASAYNDLNDRVNDKIKS